MTPFVKAVGMSSLLVCIGVVASINVNAEEYGPAKVAYDDYIKRPSLQMRTRGRIKLAQTGDHRALRILKDNYKQPEDPKDQVKYLLASIAANNLSDEAFVPIYKEWREAYTNPEDAWLWYRSQIIHDEYKGPEELLSVVRNEDYNVFVRCSALEALAYEAEEASLPVVDELLTDIEDKFKGNSLVVVAESCAAVLLSRASALGTDAFRKPAQKLIEMLGEKRKTEDRTKLVIGRYLREIFGNESVWTNPEPWLKLLLNPSSRDAVEGSDGQDGRYAKPPKPKFVGIEATGMRIVYVIDFSDSMMKPLSKKEKEELKKPKRRGPITGSGHTEEEGKEKKKKDDDELPWDKIKTRFDAAREYLKLSLRGLNKDQHFCVIWFGTDAMTLKSTKSLVPASPGNIKKAIKELDRIRPGSPTQARPLGVLKGFTNLHGGIHRAFKVTKRKMVKQWEYVDPSTFTEGADTIFILSDGDPTWDDWAIDDKRDPDDQTGDPETRVKAPDQEILNFPGPYGYRYQNTYLPDDVRRLNLFRKCEIHCIGIGEVSIGLLQNIAKWGMGEVKMVSGG